MQSNNNLVVTLWIALAVVLTCAWVQPAMAGQDTQLNTLLFSGGGSWDTDGKIRVGYAREIDWEFWSTGVGHFQPAVEAGGGLWFSSDKTDVNFDVTPMLTYVLHTDGEVTPFLEVGVGGAYIEHEEFDDRELGSHFQFRDVVGLGMAFGPQERYSLRARLVHYSNADLADENDGINFFVLSCGVSF